MAKAGFWLRGANGKLAGATIYKGADGTVMREVVKPKNPRSSKQLYQRAIIATVMRYYALGKEIFNHSFEGYGVGMPTMRRFQSVNAKRLRALVAADLANGTKKARVVAPGITSAVPNPLIASMGTYTQSFLTHNEQGNVAFPAITEGETIGAYAIRTGLIEDDIYTIVVIGQSSTDMSYEYITVDGEYIEDASVARTFLNYVQLRVKAGIADNTTVITAATPITDLFDVQFKNQYQVPENYTVGEGFAFTDLTENPDYVSGAIAIIRSREDSGLRSNSVFDMIGTANKGVTAEWILPVWRAGNNVGNSDLILEGADFSGAGGGSVSPEEPTEPGYYFIPDVISANGVQVENLVINTIAPNSAPHVVINGEALSATLPDCGLWYHDPDEEEVASPAFDLVGAEITVTTEEANNWQKAIIQWWNQHFGTSYPEDNYFADGDEGDDLTLITANWKGSI